MTAATAPLSSPGQIAANLPGILGFYPHDSLVIVAFTSTGEPDRFQLGPVMRVDLDDLHVLPEVARAVEDSGEDLVFAFLVTGRPDEEVDEIVDILLAVTRAGILDIGACWVVSEILTAEPIVLAFGPLCDIDGPWILDTVAPVTSALSMEPLLARGELPDLSRQEAHEHVLHGNPHFDSPECQQLTRFALGHARELPPTAYPDLMIDLRLLLDESRGLPLEDLLADDEAILTVAPLLGTLELRDLTIEEVLRQPAAGAQLLLAVARTCDGIIRHNALALYALCEVETGLTMRATPALLTALEEDPTHMLSRLLLPPLQAGAFDFMVSSVREGSRIVRADHGVEEPPREIDAVA